MTYDDATIAQKCPMTHVGMGSRGMNMSFKSRDNEYAQARNMSRRACMMERWRDGERERGREGQRGRDKK